MDILASFLDDGRQVPLSEGLLEIYELSVAFLAFVHGQWWSIALAGIVVAVTWWLLLRGYRQLNRARFLVIHETEKQSQPRRALMSGRSWTRTTSP